MPRRLANLGAGFLPALAVLANLAVAKANDYDPASLDLPAPIECRVLQLTLPKGFARKPCEN
ncbi:MAG: hypothetical protein E5Y88_27830 [Mesorhizobium sp.]|nr:hypothetical protein EOC94_24060 [Mesorhizobium sp. M6A.T.Ce.TU.016.01.1.1]RWQ30444.1 MAG: hypothetical protein EOS20_31520 [Mesorhizobium sp.]TIL22481.1 MAG: hypothetical protein E5Y88_27830 [Mesorhizobium sp.]